MQDQNSMNPLPFDETLRVYFQAFAERDTVHRKALLLRCMTEAAEIWGPSVVFKGYESVSEKIAGFQSRMPGARLVLASGFSIFRCNARCAVAIVGEGGSPIETGEAVFELAQDGRISRVLPFWEALPALPESWPSHLVTAK